MTGNTFLLDSSVIIDVLRRKDFVSPSLSNLARQGKLAINHIIVAELYSGKHVWAKDDERRTMDLLVQGLQIIPLTTETAVKAGELRAKYNLDLADALIAASALVLQRPLATLNVKDFKQIPKIELIEPDNYVEYVLKNSKSQVIHDSAELKTRSKEQKQRTKSNRAKLKKKLAR